PRFDGIRGAAAIDVLVLDQPGATEEGRELVELLPRPRLGLGIVTLGTLNLYAEKNAARGGGNLDRVAIQGGQVVDRRRLVIDAGGGDEGGHDLVPRPIA